MPRTTLTERVTVIETKFETIIVPMAAQVNEIHDVLHKDGLLNKVDKVVNDVTVIKDQHILDVDAKDALKKLVVDKGQERRSWFKRMTPGKKVMAIGAIVGLFLKEEIREAITAVINWYLTSPQ